jgi:hypothetical protein
MKYVQNMDRGTGACEYNTTIFLEEIKMSLQVLNKGSTKSITFFIKMTELDFFHSWWVGGWMGRLQCKAGRHVRNKGFDRVVRSSG